MKNIFTDRNCPKHAVLLVREPNSLIKGGMVYCPVCGAGGTYESVIEKRGEIIKNCFTIEQVAAMNKYHGI